jgi:hypothetical protein
MALNNFIEEYNEDGFVGTVKSVFVRLTGFLTMVAKAKRQSEINLEMLEGDDFVNNSNLFDFLSTNGFLIDVDYETFNDDVKNYYLNWWLENDEDSALQYVCDHLLTDVENRGGQYWLYLRNREELADFFKEYNRDTSPKDLAKAIFNEDDFFERFNFEKNAPFRQFFDKENPNIAYNRTDFLAILFNSNSTQWSPINVEQFIKQVADSINPVYLNYNDHHWYAEITCKVTVLSKIKDLKLVLMVEQAANKGYSWNIVAADGVFLKFKNTPADSIISANLKENKLPNVTNKKKFFLTPVSHGIDFTNLENVFINKQNIDDYIQTKQKSFELAKLIDLIKNSKIVFNQITIIRYHLLQIDGWIIKIDYFSRRSDNSGWLINDLLLATKEEKKLYLLKQLNII